MTAVTAPARRPTTRWSTPGSTTSERRGVERIGFGVITLRKAAAAPWQRLEELHGPLRGPMGPVVTDVLDAETWLRATPDDALLAERLVVAPDVTEERHGRPGEPTQP